MYSTLEEAKEEIWRRWNDAALREKAAEFLGEVPEALCNKPCAVMYRQITTPNTEFQKFLNMAKKMQLKPVSLEYLEDKFVTTNAFKLSWGKMAFYRGKNKNGEAIFHYTKVVDLVESDGKKLNEIKTLWGENFVDFHHRISMTNSFKVDIFDNSKWLIKKGHKPADYYPFYLALFICHGILFENFSVDEKEKHFSNEIILPAMKKVKEHFGVKPLIVPLVPEHETSDRYWWCYPDYIEKEIPKEWV
ncbi:MAG: hypothetical protein NTV89_10560 [Proteobacteria bacterium]|nr:hypothetical protein [Pseudomonadota bacterium]